MADVFLRDSAGGTASGADWANASLTMAAAVALLSADDRLIVADDHAETYSANTTYTFPGNNMIISSTVSGSTTVTYSIASTAQVTSNGNFGLETVGNNSYFAGVFLEGGNSFKTPDCLFYECTLNCGADSANPATSWLSPNTAGASCEYNYCDITNKSTGSTQGVIRVANRTVVEMTGGSVSSDRTTANAGHAAMDVALDASIISDGIDFSGFQTANLLLVDTGSSSRVRVTRALLNASTTVLSNVTSTEIAADITIEAVDSANTVTRKYRVSNLGELISDSTIKLSDANFSYSNEIKTNANAREFFSPVRFPIAVGFADFSAARTIVCEVAQDGTTTALDDTDVWIEVMFPDDTTAAYLVETSRAADNLSGANLTTSTEAYDGLSGTNVKQLIELTTTLTGKEGPFEVFICVAKPSISAYCTVKSIA